MGAGCQGIVETSGRKPISPIANMVGRGLPAGHEAGRESGMTPTVCVFNRTRESFLCLSAVATGNSLVPPLGFPGWFGKGARQIAREDGIWLVPSAGIYNVGTIFPVDRVYLDRENRVIQLIEHLDPLQIVPVRCPHASVLEVRTRTIYSSRTRVGDELLICPPDEVETRWKQFQEPMQIRSDWLEKEVIPCSKG